MNTFIKNQCENMKTSITIFEQACQMAAKIDDHKISKEEIKILKRINKASTTYKKELERIIEN